MSIRTRMNLNMRGVRDLYDQYKNERMYDQKDIRDEDTNNSLLHHLSGQHILL